MGRRFGRLTVVAPGPAQYTRDGHRRQAWLCKCDCGNETTVIGASLRSGHTASCGCFQRDCTSGRFTKHGACAGRTVTRLYSVWRAMLARALDPRSGGYRYYGARGITICDEWANSFGAFEAWAYSNGYDENAPRGKCTIDRIDNYLGYCPGNCRWVDMAEQRRNQRPKSEA